MLTGYFAIMTFGVDYDAMRTYQVYRLRDEQEKVFTQMKTQMPADRQRNWSEEGKTDRLFILFVSLIMSSYLKYVWKTSKLVDIIDTTLEIIDEMRPIRLVEHTNKAKYITPFVGAQVDICEAFGFDIPEGCSPTYVSRKKTPAKRGRKLKK